MPDFYLGLNAMLQRFVEETIVSFSTLLVHLDGGHANGPVLSLAAKLAERHQAKIVGLAACQPMQLGSLQGDFTGSLAVLERDIVTDELKRAKAEFESCAAIQPYVLEWRSNETLEPISHTVAEEARCADLIITSLCSGTSRNALTHADTADLIVRAGRPVVVVPDTPSAATFETVLIAWADTRECRRAVADALPILELAGRVIIAEVAEDHSRERVHTRDVIAWLARHSINADRIVADSRRHLAATLRIIAAESCADLIVAGAYGHNRLREWAFGGLTRDMLLRENICAFLSH